MIKLPTFLIIGAAKSGTTSLYYYLKQHPKIFLPKIKEINYFAYRGQTKGRFWARTREEYEAHFDDTENFHAVGEVTPLYFSTEGTPERIKRVIPETQIIAILRNPVDRAYSHYNMYVRAGRENRTAKEALLDVNSVYTRVGFYYKNLSKYFDLFDSKKVKILFFDELKSEPKKLMKELYNFLEVDSSIPLDVTAKHASSFMPKNMYLNRIIKSDFIRFKIKPIIPQKLIGLVLKLKNCYSTKPPSLPNELRSALISIYKDDILNLQEYLQKDLSRWIKSVESYE